MPEPKHDAPRSQAERMIHEVSVKQQRMMRARGQSNSIWSAIAIFGAVGWSIALPTVLGVIVGVWIDNHWPGRLSWTMTLLFGGLAIGCFNAWIHISGAQK